MIAFFHYVNFPLSTRRFLKPKSPFFSHNNEIHGKIIAPNNKGTRITHFFDRERKINRIYASNYPASARMKFVCAVNVYTRGTVVGYKC